MSIYCCHVSGCNKKLFSAKALVGHLSLMHSENRMMNLTCGLDDCNYVYNTSETFRKHVRLQHSAHWESVPPTHDSVDNEMETEVIDESSSTAQRNAGQNRTSFESFLNDFARHVAYLKLKISESYMLPKSTAQSIFQDIQSLFDIYQNELAQLLNSRLKEIGVSLSDDLIIQQFNSTDSIFQTVQNKFSTDHLFNKYMCDNLNFNSPVEKLVSVHATNSEVVTESLIDDALMPSVDVRPRIKDVKVQYVPILTTLKNYLQQRDVWASCQQQHLTNKVLCNFTDGKIWTSLNAAERSKFLRLHLYSDEVEICNPLGSRKTVHKMAMFYFLVGNIETKYWSKLTNIHLALMCRYKSIKDIDYRKLLEPLLSDIKVLETDGITVEMDGISHQLFGSIVLFSGDNLTSNTMGGFNTCFSSGRICRYCMATKLSLTDMHSEEDCKLRTLKEHTYHLQAVSVDKNLSAAYGVLRPSPFTGLECFNPISFFPPDIMHDVLEGLMVVVLKVVLRHIFKQKWLHIRSFNERLAAFKFGSSDADKFGPLPPDFLSKNKSLSGKAVEKWTFFRLLPFLVADVVPVDDEFWHLYTLCRELCEIVLAPVIDPGWLPYLELIISQHHKLLSKLSPQSFTPKVHFVTHYPRLILEYGPLRNLWVMRFEAVHQYFKQIARRVKNFRNISATLARRFQAKKCYEHAANVLLLSGATVPSCQRSVLVKHLPVDLVRKLQEKPEFVVVASQGLLSVKSLVVGGHRFKIDSYVVYDVDSEDVPIFLNIKHLLLIGGTWFVCGRRVTVSYFDSHVHAYSLDTCGDWVVLYTSQSIDCQCLSVYSYAGKSFVTLQHRVVSRALLF